MTSPHQLENPVEKELQEARRSVVTDGYPMSIGELTNMYRDEELIITPQFQRLFRWDDNQKSRLIESILVGIPLPSIFVAQDSDGRWELVDGLQRVSTLLQLQGLLRDEGYEQLVLSPTKYLPSLGGLTWDGEASLTPTQRLDIKRAKMDVKIVKRESDPKTKFDLFQRLNSFGSPLSSQEIRNALLVGISTDFANWLQKQAAYPAFQAVTQLSDRDLERKYDEELVLRFLFLTTLADDEASSLASFQEGLENFSINLAKTQESERFTRLEEVFHTTFDKLLTTNEDILKKWNSNKQKFMGGFSNTAFEAIATSLGHCELTGKPARKDLNNAAIEFWNEEQITERFATGKSTEQRIKVTIPLGRRIVSE
ncbi:GmrSD restriction endonuclease domain-containing protein [Corynebacterium tuscaniense]|uniref:GmrSD restriction endonuclease domain-containing protein n=1 Tax=Corynebacterium tuscaniense TaxID=302449 RepID=UPI00050FAB96|nr:DUF262 domain-containing protein [Corynebacterium tuscaniense]KGF22711.1 hypothetical protein HMPREF2129_06710 [Corynebacterium tuscaniense DNF00037]